MEPGFALIERELLGGDCLNVGCVPSKAIISAARAASAARRAGDYGVNIGAVDVEFGSVMERMRRLRAGISPHDSAARFTKLGVDVYIGSGRFENNDTIHVGGQALKFKKAVVCTGARAATLPIPGLDATGYLTNETVFSLTELPQRLIVIGGGPMGVELAQSFAQFGTKVVLLEQASHILSREEADAAQVVQDSLVRDGVQVALNSRVLRCGTSR